MKAIYLIAAIALMLVPLTSASYTIDPKSKSIAVTDVTDISLNVTVYNTYNDVLLDIIPTVYTNEYITNVSYSHPLPNELLEYVTIIPNELVIAYNSTGSFKIHVSLPDLPDTYNNTWEFIVRFNNTDKYSLKKGATYIDVPIRLYLPRTKPIVVAETPFFVYPFIIVFSLIFMGGLIIYLKKRAVPLAMKDHATTSSSEWAGMDVGSHPNEPAVNPEQKKGLFKKIPSIDKEVLVGPAVPKVFKDLIEDPTLPESPQRRPVIIRKPLPLKGHTINGERTAVPKRSHQKKATME